MEPDGTHAELGAHATAPQLPAGPGRPRIKPRVDAPRVPEITDCAVSGSDGSARRPAATGWPPAGGAPTTAAWRMCQRDQGSAQTTVMLITVQTNARVARGPATSW